MKNKNYYGFEDYPGFIKSALLAFEYMLMPYISLIFIIIILRSAHASPSVETSVISFAIIIYGVIALLQAVKLGPLGSKMLFPQSTSAAYFAQSFLAVKSGGLPLLAGMTVFSGAVQTVFSFLMKHIQKVFPNEIANMVMLIIGVETALVGAHQLIDFFPFTPSQHSTTWINYAIDILPFSLIMIVERLGSKNAKLFNLIVVVFITYPMIYFLGYMKPVSIHEITHSNWFALPSYIPLHYAFSWHLAIPFTIAVLVCTVKVAGCTNALLQVNEQTFDLKRASRAALTDSLGTILSGATGSMGLNVNSSLIALSVSLKMTSRVIAFFMAPIYLLTAFCPKIALLLVYMPSPIVGGILLFIGSSLFMMGIKAIVSSCNTLAKQLTIGIPLVLGFTYHTYPKLSASLPQYINIFIGSALVVATLSAILLHSFFKGIQKIKWIQLEKQ